MPLTKFMKFLAISSANIFCCNGLFLLFQRFLKFCSFLSLFFCPLGLDNFYWYGFKFTHIFLPFQYCYCPYLVRYFTISLCKTVHIFSVLKLPCGYFFHFLFLSWCFLLSICFQSIHLYFLEHFHHSCFKCLW